VPTDKVSPQELALSNQTRLCYMETNSKIALFSTHKDCNLQVTLAIFKKIPTSKKASLKVLELVDSIRV